MRPKDLKDVLMDSLLSGSGVDELGSIYIEGRPGVGKSEVVQSVVDAYNHQYGDESAGLIDFRLTLCDPSDLRGIPYPNVENKLADWFQSGELPNPANHAPVGILFFDDLTTAAPMVQAAAYQLVIKPHRLGSYKLPEGWIIVGAGNGTGDKALVNKMPKPLANRFFHLEYEYHIDDWVDWALDHSIDTRIIGFLKSPASYTSETHLLMNFDPAKADNAFATPRSWASVSRVLDRHMNSTNEKSLIQGAIGQAAANTFFSFLRLVNDIPDPSVILDKGDFDVKLTTPDAVYAMIVGVANNINTAKHMDNAITWSMHLDRDEYSILLLKIINRKESNQELLLESNSYEKFVRKFKETQSGL